MKKKAGKSPGRKPTPPEKRHQNIQVTLAPSVVEILKSWEESTGPGTRSHNVSMAIRYAHKKGLFDDETRFARADNGGGDTTLQGAVNAHLPRMIENIVRKAIEG